MQDPSTQSNFNSIITAHIHWEVYVLFDKKTIKCKATYTLKAIEDGVKECVFDTKDLVVDGVFSTEHGDELKHETKEGSNKVFGQPLHVSLKNELNRGQTTQITVAYATCSTGSALQWLSASQTAGKEHPFLFTQCQAIHARTMLPCQDSPAVKATFTATVTVPGPLVAVMGANSTGSYSVAEGRTTYTFKQPVPIPSYLIALAVGHVKATEIGPRTKVWAEPETLTKSAWEFTETESYIAIAEQVCGPYVWGRYDLIVLPPSFPYGGMENPMLTFVTPTLLSGDRSQTCLIAHEIAHSWTGNLVTNVTWEHFWLNEGFTKYVERLILRYKFSEAFRQMHAMAGWVDLKGAIDFYGPDHEFTKLVPSLEGRDPDDAFSRVPYEKGFSFLYYLEGLVGGVEEMEAYLKVHVETFKYATLSSNEWWSCFVEFFERRGKGDALKEVDIDEWLYGTGMPPFQPVFDHTLTEVVEQLALRWMEAAKGSTNVSFVGGDIKDLLPQQLSAFMMEMVRQVMESGTPFPHELLARLDQVYRISEISNPEVKLGWYSLCLRAGYEPIIPYVV
eukprot:Ihof_evm13s57 gene=Ihof_evmTU13s57